MRISCIILTRNNAEAFRETLGSVLAQRPRNWNSSVSVSWTWSCEIICIDSSDPPLAEDKCSGEMQRLPFQAAEAFTFQCIHQYPPRGVYPAMNLAMSVVSGESLMFMNAGDSFFDATSLDRLHGTAIDFHRETGGWPRFVFGQALIQQENGHGLCWLVPDSSVRRIGRWLRCFLPNHQTVLMEREWAVNHPFRLDAPHSADRSWLRQALEPPTTFVYLPQPVVIFRLGGLSSGLPDRRILRLRLAEPSRTKWEKAAEVIKYLLRPAARWYPLLMRYKSAAVGLFCR